MNIGNLSIVVSFIAAVGACLLFLIQWKRGVARHSLAAMFYLIAVIGGIFASGILLFDLVFHRFQYSYVVHHSSRDLPLLYLVSAFWAGQEGTFLLWAVMSSLMGLMFIRMLRGKDDLAMSIVSAFVGFLYLLMIVKSPFDEIAPVPLDGAGLNPLLQDPWMAIHPPLLFLGYAATIFGFALVVSGLIRRNFDNWLAFGFQWTLFCALTLGAGIILGGFWAYEVLGWGGYWGWDPVENASLVPWLMLIALIHGLLVQRVKGSLVRTNLFLGLMAFLLVLYATFLTRSGILANFSVHSFTNLGINNYLLGVLILSIGGGFGFFIARFKSIESHKINILNINRELALVGSLYVVCAIAVFTFIGMSFPILTGLVGMASQVETSFYNKVNMPVAIAMAILLGVTPFLDWIENNLWMFFKQLSLPLILTVLSAIIASILGVHSLALFGLVVSAAFALISNTIIAVRQYRSGWLHLGGPVAHIGVALLLIGIVGSGSFDKSTQLTLNYGEPQIAYGYQFTFQGITDRQAAKPLISLNMSDGKDSFIVTPKLYYSKYMRATMSEPAIKIFPLKDLYVSPIEIDTPASGAAHLAFELTEGETKSMGPYDVTFEHFDVRQHAQAGAMSVGAVLKVSLGGNTTEVIPRLAFVRRGEKIETPVDLPLSSKLSDSRIQPRINLSGVNVEARSVSLELLGSEEHAGSVHAQQLVVEISVKPLMMFVWAGVVLIIIGMAIAWCRRVVSAGVPV